MPENSESAELASELILEQMEVDESDSQVHRWHKQVALSTLILALLAAVGGLLSGISAQENVLEKTEEIFSLTVLEGDRVSVEVLKAKHEILISLGEIQDEAEIEAIKAFEAEIVEMREEFTEDETLAQAFGQTHLRFAISVTFLAAGITLSGMSVVVQQKWLWVVGMVIGAVGTIGIVLGIISMLK